MHPRLGRQGTRYNEVHVGESKADDGNMPIILQTLCQAFPAKWFIVAIKSVMIKGVGLQYIWIELLVMMAMALIFLTIGIKKFSKQFA